ncbi:MAG TPA: PBP1A family penicillin-binding protein [Alphaproteobacteria bacterium]|nr:PBP1A family penicillin-binding protein [Alphaproteobacteria bacterium]
MANRRKSSRNDYSDRPSGGWDDDGRPRRNGKGGSGKRRARDDDQGDFLDDLLSNGIFATIGGWIGGLFKPSKKSGAKKPKRSLGRRIAFGTLKWGFIAGVWGALALAGVIAYYAYDMPRMDGIPQLAKRPAVTLLARDGTPFAYFGDSSQPPVPVKEMSPYLPQAVMAIEDRRYYSHFGMDPIGVLRALYTNIRHGGVSQGGSTLTQQLAKNLFLTPERTIKRKIQEVLVAFWLESKYSKDELLTLYLNRVYLGSGTFGMPAAADRYFDKKVQDLSLPEAAMLAGLLQAPSRYAPTRDLARAERRTDVVLAAMADAGFISEAQAKAAQAQPVKLARQGDRIGRYFADWALDQVNGYLGSVTSDITVQTTIDIKIQRAAEQKLAQMVKTSGAKAGVEQGAVLVMDPAGAVRAMTGGVDYAESQFNRATRALRQPGSSFKMFVYAAALDAGLTPDSPFTDAPFSVGDYSPRNYEGSYRGPVTMEQAVAHSINTVAVQVLQRVGVDRVIQWARRLGITTPLKREAGLALGASEVTLLEMTSAYAAFANEGSGVWAYGVTEVKDSAGTVIYQRLGSGPGLRMSPRMISDMNRLLGSVVSYGTGRAANIGRPIYGKTGTTDDYRDAWFVGYSADYVAGVWLGNDDRTPTKRVTGGGLPAQLWRDVMLAAHEGVPVRGVSPGYGEAAIADSYTPPPQQAPARSSGGSIWDDLFGSVMSLGGSSSSNQRSNDQQRRPAPPTVRYEYPSDRENR